ncbi:MAG: glycosyltransferase family 2 protein [Nitrospinae bacterium]|nr:glycosyltransferase family 2 protein [Nitrospinota bacterium]
MKLIVQIPCRNEEEYLPITLRDIPRKIEGVDCVEILVIDDGSADRTSDVAREAGVEHIIRFTNHKGLAAAFSAGLDACLKLGADIIVNTDADNQYQGADIPKLIAPILAGKADIIVGDREVGNIPHFSKTKIFLQKLGSFVVRRLSGTNIPDVTSGFRAFNREAALRLNVVSRFTYTLETIISAGRKSIAIDSVKIRTNQKLRESRLFRSNFYYIKESIITLSKIFSMYRPLQIFTYIGTSIFTFGFLLGLRYLYFFFLQSTAGHIQSLILSAICLIVGFQICLIGLVSELISINREKLEDILYRIKKIEMKNVRGPKK